jgi:exodeoxyribonuclease X
MIRVVDIETTGMEPGEGAEVIELGWYDVGPERRFGVRFHGTQRPCPPEVRAVHHIHPSEYEGMPPFSRDLFMAEICRDSIRYLAAHNAEYEQRFLGDYFETPWLCTYKCALRVWPEAPHHGNQSLMYWLGLDTELDEGQRHPPHRALPDAYVTAAILRRLLCETTLDQMVQWSTEPRLLPRCPIGKFRNKPWSEVDRGFLDWMLRQADMEADLKWNARREIDRRRRD